LEAGPFLSNLLKYFFLYVLWIKVYLPCFSLAP
jgi:hypothetical protein